MTTTFRFIKEYSNYINSRIKKADLPTATQKEYYRQNEKILQSVYSGMVTLNDCMQMLVNLEKVVNDIIAYG